MTDAQELADARWRLARVRRLVDEHPPDAVPVVELGELRAALDPPAGPGTGGVEVARVVRTLRYCATHLADVYGADDEPVGWTAHWLEAAGALERFGLDDGGCCPVCQEVGCDADCPMVGLR